MFREDKCRKKGRETHYHVKIAGKEAILEDASVGDVNALTLVRHNDHRPTERHVSSEIHITRHRQVVQLNDLRDLLEALLELLDLRRKESGISVLKESFRSQLGNSPS